MRATALFACLLALTSTSTASADDTARGVVFLDANNNGARDADEQPLQGIKVSNGRQIVKTDQAGRYELPVTDDTILFVIKPRGYRTPLSEQMVPRFYYIHKPNGSPKNYQFAGVEPTGPLPESVDFPLYKQDEPERFQALMFGDPQPRTQEEVDWISHDVIEELIGTEAKFGVTLGDIMFDDLNLFDSSNSAIAVLGIPWYNVIGNHDLNHEAHEDHLSDETFERHFGPPYYSFDYGAVHFIVLDDVEWRLNEAGQGGYRGGLGEDQLAFVERDLELIPDDQLVVLMMHIPVTKIQTPERLRLYRLIEQRPFCMSIAGHEHFHEHRFLKQADGWNGPQPHHHVVNVTVCGNWWGGMQDERGIPHATMGDGAPNGYSIMTFDGHEYQLEFRAAGRPADYQMNVDAPEEFRASDGADIVVNVFNGSEKSTVEMQVGPAGGEGQEWTKLAHTPMRDPDYVRMAGREDQVKDSLTKSASEQSLVFNPDNRNLYSTHIWKGRLPAGLAPGTHCVRIRTTDMHGMVHHGYRLVRVVE
ncbi:Calcineurin-like phosphoesterase [Posidoniimonas corsicana]|uniref:Calcineurin-like phosphoesterase n=1 Tax=Posidoniimonas corsicana TaxID=1938618 RepID=A0A5C5UXK9_9BACT|nr:calcineurin-like phosphoesterase family protein [Posidoniimonas corsicana]TWT30202.1 Calcineurin-like phosphoesterase [Posidoniimonas corsicana]